MRRSSGNTVLTLCELPTYLIFHMIDQRKIVRLVVGRMKKFISILVIIFSRKNYILKMNFYKMFLDEFKAFLGAISTSHMNVPVLSFY